MDMKVLLIVFLCLFSVSIVCNVAIARLNMPLVCSRLCYEHVGMSRLILGGDGNEPEGDPIVRDGWP